MGRYWRVIPASVWTQTPAHRSTDNLESFLISRNYTEGLIVLRSLWKWNMLHRGPDGKGYCLPFIHNWEILNVKPVGENATEATEHRTTKLHGIVSAQRGGTRVVWCTSVPRKRIVWSKYSNKPSQYNVLKISSCSNTEVPFFPHFLSQREAAGCADSFL